MEIAQELIFASNTHTKSQLLGRLQSKAYDIQVHDLEWMSYGSGLLTPQASCFLELVFKCDSSWEGSYSATPNKNSFKNIGALVFAPPQTTLHCQWDKGSQQTIGCMFNINNLSALHGLDWDWSAIDLEHTFDIQNPFIVAAMRRLAEEAITPSFASELQTEYTLVLLALELRRHFLSALKAPKITLSKLSHHQISLINELIDSSTGAGPSLDDFAEACNIPARQLSILFKNMTGVTLRHYVANTRLKKAKHILSNRHLMIKQVAYQCGFKSATAFSAAFRKETGVTPLEFRKALEQ
ncbi:MAG: AraC family transcriptional regulator [Spongiibacteraceae bacterium]